MSSSSEAVVASGPINDPAAVPKGRARPAELARKAAHRWGVLVVGVLVWELVTRIAGSVYFPPPTYIVAAAARQWFSGAASQLWLSGSAYADVLPSLGRLFAAWLAIAVGGSAIGIALGRSRTAIDYVQPLFDFARSMPSPALVPVFLALFSIGTPMQLATIVFGTVFTVVLNTADGARSVDGVKLATVRSFGIRRADWLLRVVLPAAAPKIFAGLRISLSQGLILMVVSEMVGSINGIGYQLVYTQRQFDFDAMWAVIALLAVCGYLLNTGLLAVQRRVLSWQAV